MTLYSSYKGKNVLDDPAVFSTLTTEAATLVTRPCSVAYQTTRIRCENLASHDYTPEEERVFLLANV
jgi:hypothetical protein